jgi:hypothetical protein
MAEISEKPKQTAPVHTIVLYPRPHADTILSTFLLRRYGGEAFPGVTDAKIEFWTKPTEGKTGQELLKEGFLLVDMGGGPLDHHGTKECASQLIANHFGIAALPELQKLLTWVNRDEKEGKGTTSKDAVDRALGLSGLIMSLHRQHLDNPQRVLDAVLPLFEAHVAQEKRRLYDVPNEWAEAQKNGKTHTYTMKHGKRDVKVVRIETTSTDLVGFLRNSRDVNADIVVQLMPSKHINIISNQKSEIRLEDTARILRIEEARKKKIDTTQFTPEQLGSPGRLPQLPEWFYDTAANTLQNGGVIPDSVAATQLSADEVTSALLVGLNETIFEKLCPPQGCRGTHCYFFDYALGRCVPRKLQQIKDDSAPRA